MSIYRELITSEARCKLNAKARAIDEKTRRMRAEYTNARIAQHRNTHNGIRTKHK